jgi:hypothetical protein
MERNEGKRSRAWEKLRQREAFSALDRTYLDRLEPYARHGIRLNMRKFHFVDFAAHFRKGFRNHIVSITEVPALTKAFNRYGCYATYYLYSDEILSYMSARKAAAAIAGYEGRVWAPFLLSAIH